MADKRRAGVQIKITWQDDRWVARAVHRGKQIEVRDGKSMSEAMEKLQNRLERYDWYAKSEA